MHQQQEQLELASESQTGVRTRSSTTKQIITDKDQMLAQKDKLIAELQKQLDDMLKERDEQKEQVHWSDSYRGCSDAAISQATSAITITIT